MRGVRGAENLRRYRRRPSALHRRGLQPTPYPFRPGLSQPATVRGPHPPAPGQISGLIAVPPQGAHSRSCSVFDRILAPSCRSSPRTRRSRSGRQRSEVIRFRPQAWAPLTFKLSVDERPGGDLAVGTYAARFNLAVLDESLAWDEKRTAANAGMTASSLTLATNRNSSANRGRAPRTALSPMSITAFHVQGSVATSVARKRRSSVRIGAPAAFA